MDFNLLLPADNASSGFDNLADLLFVSPSDMESYLNAAQKISRLAVGDPSMPVMVSRYLLPDEQPQDSPVDELPFGTRGGLAVRTDLPMDGEYLVKVELAGAAREAEQLEISVDGAPVEHVKVGGSESGRGGRGGRAARASAAPLEFRIPIQAGPRLIGVTFVEQDAARDEQTLRPRMRSRGTQTALATVTISGPYDAKGPGDTPTRQRIFVCHPRTSAEEFSCAKQILATLERRAWRRPVADADVQRLIPFYNAGLKEGGFELGIQRAIERLLVSPQFLFRIERDPPNNAPGIPYPVSNLELASRLSFFLWSSIPDDELLNVATEGKLKDAAVLEQ